VTPRAALRALSLCGALLATACAELQLHLPAEEFRFELAGRIAVHYRGEASSGNIAWRHGGSADEVLLTSPLGQGVARIVRAGGSVLLSTPDGREHRASDAEALTEAVLGFRLPLDGLADWVRARAGPGPHEALRDASGRLAELRQSGWTIEYQTWGADGALPSRLKLTYPGIELRLAIAEWK
jgi:outer membrane lipoprotein LolB